MTAYTWLRDSECTHSVESVAPSDSQYRNHFVISPVSFESDRNGKHLMARWFLLLSMQSKIILSYRPNYIINHANGAKFRGQRTDPSKYLWWEENELLSILWAPLWIEVCDLGIVPAIAARKSSVSQRQEESGRNRHPPHTSPALQRNLITGEEHIHLFGHRDLTNEDHYHSFFLIKITFWSYN